MKRIARSVNTSYHRARYAATKTFHLGNGDQEADRAERCEEIQRLFPREKNPVAIENVWFSDEKIFTSMPKS